MLRSFATLFCTLTGTLVLGPIAIVVLPLERSGRWLKRLQRWWGRWILFGAGVRIAPLEGAEHLLPGQRQLFVANHQSLLDIPVLFAALPVPVVMAAKKELFRIPLFGWMMYAARFPKIDRANPDAAKQALQRSAERLRGTGVSVVLFPEGTRSRDGSVAAFKKGAFFVARDLGIPLVPVALAGTGAALRKGSLRVRASCVRLRFQPALDPRGRAEEERDAVMEEARARVLAALAELEAARPRGASEGNASTSSSATRGPSAG
ncbi:MAG: 1-acyl-sn-glycerol-3-phosphate acyltransferase [Planctomycetes bacterium]|nr:1-acyl-sn-glycerol-3-phosphate acyltransferase [Planctomycetota bacterium]